MSLRINEVETQFNVRRSTLLEWERRGYLRCERTPGGHRRYKEEDIKAVLEADGREPTYIVYYNTYRPLPDVIKVMGSYGVGKSSGFMAEGEEWPDGYTQAELATYYKNKVFTIDGFDDSRIELVLEDDVGDTGVSVLRPKDRLGRTKGFCKHKIGDGGELYLATWDMFAEAAVPYSLRENRHSKTPHFLWGMEIVQVDPDLVIDYVSYDRVKIC